MTDNTTPLHATDTHRSDWGPWYLDAELRVLYPAGRDRYEVDLDRCLTSAQLLDCVCQVAGKRWADDATLAGLVRALNDVLKPQANLCSFGQAKRVGISRVTELVERAVARPTKATAGSGVANETPAAWIFGCPCGADLHQTADGTHWCSSCGWFTGGAS
jgi:hypothetical protein